MDEGTARQNTNSGYYCTSSNGCHVWGNQTNTLYNGSSLGDSFHYSYYNGASSATIHTPATGWPCKESNWAVKNYLQWSLSPYLQYNYSVWYMHSSGYFYGTAANSIYPGVRPAFYLKSTIQLAGQGTIEKPYYIVES